MGKYVGGVLLIATIGWGIVGCNSARKNVMPTPEAEQVISERLKNLYMAASAATPQSAKQQNVILRMAETASNGKELLLVVRAAVGVFPPCADPPVECMESRVGSLITAKMVKFATLNQLIEYAMKYPVSAANGRPLAERLFELGSDSSDPRVWHGIKAAASHLKARDLEQQAQARGERLAGR